MFIEDLVVCPGTPCSASRAGDYTSRMASPQGRGVRRAHRGGRARRRGPARRRSRCARPACSRRCAARGATRGQPVRPLALPLPRRPRRTRGAQRGGGGLRRARRRRRDDARPRRGLHRRAGRRLHAGGGHGGGRPRARWASRWASSTSTPTPTSTRPRPRPPATCTGWPWRWRWAAARRRSSRRRARRPPCEPEHVALVGFRELDPGERAPLGDLGLALPAAAARRLGMRVAAALALDGVGNDDGPVVVHLDVDVIDPQEMPATRLPHPGRRPVARRGVRPAHRAPGLAARGGARGRASTSPSTTIRTTARARASSS